MACRTGEDDPLMSATPRLGPSFANGASPSRRFTARPHLDRCVSGESQPSAAVFRVWLHGFGPVKAAKMSMNAVNAFIAGIVWWSMAMNGPNPAAAVLNGVNHGFGDEVIRLSPMS